MKAEPSHEEDGNIVLFDTKLDTQIVSCFVGLFPGRVGIAVHTQRDDR